MKKLICLLAFSGLLLASCSSSEDSNPPTEGEALVKRTIETYAIDGSVVTSDYTYNGNKLVKVLDSDGYYEKYFYTGDLVTKIEFYDFDDVLEETAEMTYNSSGQLIEYLMTEPIDGLANKEVYLYNSDGTVSFTSYSGNLVSQTVESGTGTIHLLGGEVSMIEYDQGLFNITRTYTYDTKNSPFKNVTGFDKLVFMGVEATGGVHSNVLTETEAVDGTVMTTANGVYTYNSINFPLTWVETENADPDTRITTQYIYF